MKRYRRLKNIQPMVRYATVIPLLLILFVTSCAREDLNWLLDTPITLTASTEQATTRTGANVQTTNFEAGETINAYFSLVSDGTSLGKAPTILTASAPDGGKNVLTPDVQPYYPQTDKVNIYALYPASIVNKESSYFEVLDNQEDPEDYKKSDLMWAGINNQKRETGNVNLPFTHKMAKMVLTINGTEDVLIKKVSLINTLRRIDLTPQTGVLASNPTAEADAEKKTIVVASTQAENGELQLNGAALFPPQTIAGNFIEVNTNFGTAWFSVVNKAFEGGAQYSANLTVTRQAINNVATITDWKSDGGSIAVPPGSSVGLRIEAIPDQGYDGTAKTPKLKITYTPNDKSGNLLEDNTLTLVEGKDYTAEYFNNTNIGTATIIITGMASPDRQKTEEDKTLANIIAQIKAMTSFNITAHEGQLSYPSDEKEVEYEYNKTVAHELDKHKGDGKFTFSSSDEKVATVSVSGVVTIRNAGKTRITASMDNSGNYTAASAYYDLTVTERSIKKAKDNDKLTAELAVTSFPYNGAAYTPAVVVKDNGRTLQEGKHYTYSAVNNTNVGTATITIKGMGNYSPLDADDITLTFKITGIEPKITMETEDVKLSKGQKFTRRATTNYGTIEYSVSPTGYATIDDGVVTATAVGDKHASVDVTISAKVAAHPDGNWSAKTESYKLTVVESNWEYKYSDGQIQEWTCPVDGVYQLEALGAKGADTDAFSGGRGADIAGQVFIKEGQKLYIYLGQGGSVRNTSYTFNGGGRYSGSTADGIATRFTGGGGATDFSLIKNTDWNNEDHLYSRILVAGGGGGALYCNSGGIFCGGGGSGGGESQGTTGDADYRAEYVGEAGYGGSHPGGGGTLSAGGAITTGGGGTNGGAGSFGVGGSYGGAKSVGLGGGGWYGGAAGSDGTRQGAGGGGSSFIYNTANINAAGNNVGGKGKGYRELLKVPTSNNYFTADNLEITPSILVTGGSPEANGQARITYMSAE